MSQPTQEEMDGKLLALKYKQYASGRCCYIWIFRNVYAEYKEAFALFDTEGDGKIDSDQIGSLLRSLNLNPDDEDIDKIEKDVGE